MTQIHQAHISDQHEIAEMCALLWPDASAEEHRPEIATLLTTGLCGTLPAAIFVATGEDGSLTGFIQVGLRSHADGCDPTHPVGFIEGWFVREPHRYHSIGKALLQAAEAWSRQHHCTEMASDTWIDHTPSEQAHQALGFEIVDRCIHFRKSL